ncbi:MAG: flagellar biosynthesis anti-sigma factor FlgM [Candidatus Omnitrophica bacterium]|nr:flagellar biosynthesis anti-sigma factor FlgM [Candidatus Omnitrophota bacterium]
MSIGQIQPDGGVNPLKDQHVDQASKSKKADGTAEKAKLGGDSVELSDRAKLFQEIDHLKKELVNIPSPNEGRINELKEAIANGTLLNDESINATAQRLADQLFS